MDICLLNSYFSWNKLSSNSLVFAMKCLNIGINTFLRVYEVIGKGNNFFKQLCHIADEISQSWNVVVVFFHQ